MVRASTIGSAARRLKKPSVNDRAPRTVLRARVTRDSILAIAGEYLNAVARAHAEADARQDVATNRGS